MHSATAMTFTPCRDALHAQKQSFCLSAGKCLVTHACLSTNFLQANNVNTLPRPSGSPHLAPIEHVLDMLSRQIRENHHPFKSLQELENALIIEWNAIPQYKFQQIIRGMEERCIATITANGAWTIYCVCEFIMFHLLQIRKFGHYDVLYVHVHLYCCY